jgi:hypothetical protein
MANQACERAQSDKVLLKFIGRALDLLEREAKLLGLGAAIRNRKAPLLEMQPNEANHLERSRASRAD